MKPDLLSKFFKPKKARAQSMKPEPDPSPKKIWPDPPLLAGGISHEKSACSIGLLATQTGLSK
jgi:hypothetical protein